jgi:hypothetical protein
VALARVAAQCSGDDHIRPDIRYHGTRAEIRGDDKPAGEQDTGDLADPADLVDPDTLAALLARAGRWCLGAIPAFFGDLPDRVQDSP